MTPDELPHHLDPYLAELQRQGKSAHTLAAYRRDLQQLFSLLPAHGQSVGRNDFVAVLKKLSQQNQSERSLARKLSVCGNTAPSSCGKSCSMPTRQSA